MQQELHKMENNAQKPSKSITIDLHELYKYEPEDICLDINQSSYSNMAYVQVSHRDVSIDFLEMPGIRRDNKNHVKGTRIYMSHAAAQKLSEALAGLLEKVHSDGGIENYIPSNEKIQDRQSLTTNIKRAGSEKSIK